MVREGGEGKGKGWKQGDRSAVSHVVSCTACIYNAPSSDLWLHAYHILCEIRASYTVLNTRIIYCAEQTARILEHKLEEDCIHLDHPPVVHSNSPTLLKPLPPPPPPPHTTPPPTQTPHPPLHRLLEALHRLLKSLTPSFLTPSPNHTSLYSPTAHPGTPASNTPSEVVYRSACRYILSWS